MTKSAGIRSLAIHFPKTVRTNDYFRAKYPDLVARAEEGALAKTFSSHPSAADAAGASQQELDPFTREMLPYLSDPFRGTVERRVVAPGETALSLEVAAARKALAAAGMTPGDVDLILVSSFLPDQVGVGNAVFVARELGTHRPAWNVETACASSVAGLEMACALVRSGQFRNVLVVVSCTYSRNADETDTFSWFLGDGAAAFVVSETPAGFGFLGAHNLATTETCDTFAFVESDAAQLARGGPRVAVRCTPGSGALIRDTAIEYVQTCCLEATRNAGIELADVDFLVVGTQAAWLSAFASRALGIPKERTVDVYPKWGNVAAVLVPANLHAAASDGRIKRGDRVLLYNFGGASSACATVIRWGDVALSRNDD